jgi:hypothetical protein
MLQYITGLPQHVVGIRASQYLGRLSFILFLLVINYLKNSAFQIVGNI